MVRGIEEDINVLRGGVGGGGNEDIGRINSLSSSVRVGSNLCRMFFCDVFQGLI